MFRFLFLRIPDTAQAIVAGALYVFLIIITDECTLSCLYAGFFHADLKKMWMRFLNTGFFAADHKINIWCNAEGFQFLILDIGGHIGSCSGADAAFLKFPEEIDHSRDRL